MKTIRFGVILCFVVVVLQIPGTLMASSPGETPAGGPGHSDRIVDMHMDPGGKFIVTADISDIINIWDIETGKLLRTFKREEKPATAESRPIKQKIAMDPDGQCLASVGNDGKIRIWNPDTGELINTLVGFPSTTMVAVGSECKPIVSTGGKFLFFWDMNKKEPQHKIISFVNAMAIDPASGNLVLGFIDGTIHVRSPGKRQLVRKMRENASGIQGLAIDTTGRFIISKNRDGSIDIWEPAMGTIPRTIEDIPGKRIFKVVVDPTGRYMAATGGIWTLPEGIRVRYLDKTDSPVGFDKDGRTFMFVNRDGVLEIRAMDTWQKLRAFPVSSKE